MEAAKNGFVVIKINYSHTFEDGVASLYYSLFDVFKILQLNNVFYEKGNCKK